jgi:hypothetical protein
VTMRGAMMWLTRLHIYYSWQKVHFGTFVCSVGHWALSLLISLAKHI